MSNMVIEHRAAGRDLLLWSAASAERGRYDYTSKRHRMSEMLNDVFFGDCWHLLKEGDYIMVTDCEDQIVNVRVDIVDKSARKVYLSRIDRLYALPIVELKTDLPDDPGLTYRMRGPRGGGHCIVCSDGAVFAVNFDTRQDAERYIANCYADKIFQAPAGHEPTEQFVSKNSKAYKPAI